jgi:hypothetical protein
MLSIFRKKRSVTTNVELVRDFVDTVEFVNALIAQDLSAQGADPRDPKVVAEARDKTPSRSH